MRLPVPTRPEDTPFFRCLRSEMKELLARVIAELPEKEQQVLALYYFEELTMKEVGAVLGIGESRVSQIHSLAVVRLRSRLEEMMSAGGGRPRRASAPQRLREITVEREVEMEKVLNQEEIDAMVRAARSGGGRAAPASAARGVEPWDVRRAGQIGREQLQAITSLHEGFARNLTHALGAYLRVVFRRHAGFRRASDLPRISAAYSGDHLSCLLPARSAGRECAPCNST